MKPIAQGRWAAKLAHFAAGWDPARKRSLLDQVFLGFGRWYGDWVGTGHISLFYPILGIKQVRLSC